VNRQPDFSTPEQSLIQIRHMWEGGPLRQWSEKREKTSWLRHLDDWVGMYVCEDCREPAPYGVYSVAFRSESGAARNCLMWLCGACKEAGRQRREQPAGLRRYLTRKREEALMGVGVEGPSSQI
jgi:hypothetical protein